METILNKKGNSSQILEWSIIHVFSKLHSCRLKRLFLREFTPSPQLRTFHATTVLPTVVGLFDFTLSLGNRNCRSAASFLPPQQLEAGKKDQKADNIWRERLFFPQCISMYPTWVPRPGTGSIFMMNTKLPLDSSAREG